MGLRVDKSLLVQIAVCAVPPMALVGFGAFGLGAYLLFGTLLLLLLYHSVEGHGPEVLTLVVGCVPVMMLLRGLFVYSSLQVIMAGSVAVMLLSSQREWERFRRDTLLLLFIGGSVVYWLASAFLTGDYAANFRILELCLAAANVRMLAGYRSYLATAFLGLAISALAIAGGLMPYGPRLGITENTDDVSIGNPISLGLAASMGFLLAIADKGQWILLHQRPYGRVVLNLLMGAALVLSTSRGSWLVTLVCLSVILVCNPRSRGPMLASLALFGVLVAGILQTDRGPIIMHYVDNAIGDDKSLDKRTTGRADQWRAFPQIFNDSPWGFGPASGKAVSLRYTAQGKTWHSLYLWIGVELGMLGLTALASLLIALAVRCARHLSRTSEVLPLVGLVGAMMIGVSVSGIDAITGVFFGVAFLGNDLANFKKAILSRRISIVRSAGGRA